VRRETSSFAPDVVFHLAAQAIVRDSYDVPVETFDTNLMGSVHVLDALRSVPETRAIVMVTSDKCYENVETTRGYREDDRLGGHDPYSASKAAAEMAVAAYRRSFFGPGRRVGVATTRAGNVIGGGDWARDRIVPDCIRALRAGRPVEVRNPSHVRPWQHVLEPLSGYLTLARRMLAEPGGCSEAFNFGPGSTALRPVGDLVGTIVSEWGSGQWVDASDASAPHEAGLLVLDASKASQRLGWRPVYGFEETVRATVEWYRRFDTEDVYALGCEQIAAYESTAAAAGAAAVPAPAQSEEGADL
jgi:CDP-glucose 4,6-dehydratase